MRSSAEDPSAGGSNNKHSRRRRRIVLIGMSLGSFLILADTSALNIALPTLQRDFDTTVSGLQWVVSAYLVAFGGFLLSAGRFSDRVGAKRAFISGVGLFVFSSLACCFAWSVLSLSLFRFAQGVSAAVITASATALLRSEYPDPSDRVRALATFATVPTVGLLSGPVLGGVLVDSLGWESIFALNVLVGPLVLLAVWGAAPTTRHFEVREDWWGQVLGVTVLVGLAVTVIEGGSRGYLDSVVLAGAGATLVMLLLFTRVERRHVSPLMPPVLFRSSAYLRCTLAGGLWTFAAYGLSFVLANYMQQEMNYSVAATGLAFLPQGIAPFITNLLLGRAVERHGAVRVARGGLAVAAIGLALQLAVDANGPYAAIAASMVLAGLGSGVIHVALSHEILRITPANRAGIASGVYNCARQLGSLLGVAILGAFLQIWADDLTFGFHLAVSLSVFALLFGSILVLRRRPFECAEADVERSG